MPKAVPKQGQPGRLGNLVGGYVQPEAPAVAGFQPA